MILLSADNGTSTRRRKNDGISHSRTGGGVVARIERGNCEKGTTGLAVRASGFNKFISARMNHAESGCPTEWNGGADRGDLIIAGIRCSSQTNGWEEALPRRAALHK